MIFKVDYQIIKLPVRYIVVDSMLWSIKKYLIKEFKSNWINYLTAQNGNYVWKGSI